MAVEVKPRATPEPLATVQQYVDAFNRGDVKAMTDAFAVPASILDGMPPHVWQGTSPAEDWYRDVLSTTRKEGTSDFVVTLGEPLHADTRDSAYLVLPATMSFRVRDKAIGFDVHCGAPQARRRLANSCMGAGKRVSICCDPSLKLRSSRKHAMFNDLSIDVMVVVVAPGLLVLMLLALFLEQYREEVGRTPEEA